MRTAPVSDDLLNAYVDGELSSREAASLARHAAQDTAIAARIAMLYQLKAGVAALAGGAALAEPPEVAQPPRTPRVPLRRAGLVLAGMAAALVLLLGSGWYATRSGPAPQDAASLVSGPGDPFVAGHDRWSQALDRSADMPLAPEWLADVMQATGLRLVHAAPAETGAGPVMHYAFVGSNDCRLSLFEQPLPGEVDMALNVAFAGGLLTARWQMRGFGYTMVARAMDSERFTTIAAAVLDVTRDRQPAGEAIVASLRAARQRCAV